jgi:hypothetical protein
MDKVYIKLTKDGDFLEFLIQVNDFLDAADLITVEDARYSFFEVGEWFDRAKANFEQNHGKITKPPDDYQYEYFEKHNIQAKINTEKREAREVNERRMRGELFK